MFYIQIFVLCFTLLDIYVCLKWNKFPFVENRSRQITDENELKKFNCRQSLIRICLIVLGIIIDALAYYLADYSSAMYLGIMLMLCLPFVINNVSTRP